MASTVIERTVIPAVLRRRLMAVVTDAAVIHSEKGQGIARAALRARPRRSPAGHVSSGAVCLITTKTVTRIMVLPILYGCSGSKAGVGRVGDDMSHRRVAAKAKDLAGMTVDRPIERVKEPSPVTYCHLEERRGRGKAQGGRFP